MQVVSAAQPAPRRRWLDLLVLLVYTLLAIAVTWPVATHFTANVVGAVDGVDAYQNAWNLWWTAYALTSGQNPFVTPLLYYPVGVDLFWQTLGFSQGLTALPVTLTLGPLAAFNFTLLASFIVAAYATFVFARRLTGSTLAALVGGTVYAFSPFHLEKVIDGNLEVAAIHWLPLYVLALYALLERPAWWRALLAGGLLLWVSLGSWYYGLFALLFSGAMLLVWLPGRPPRAWPRLLFWGAVPLLLWGAVLAPQLLALAAAGDSALHDLRGMQVARSADLMDFFLPNPAHPWWRAALWEWRAQFYPDAVIWNVALGWIGLALGLLGAATAWNQNWRWSVLLLVALVLAMGPVLKVGGVVTSIPLPFALIQDLPGVRAGQRPNHMVVLASLMLALLSAYGAAWLLDRVRRNGRPLVAIGLVLAIVALDGNAGLLTPVQRTVHPFYATLPAADGGLLPLPLYINVNRSENLTPQMVHHWPIVGGYIARPPDYPFARYTPGVYELQFGVAEPDDILSPGWPELGRQALAAYAIRYVALDLTSAKDSYFVRVRERLAELAVGPPLLADTQLEAYALPRDWPARPVAFLGAGWQPLEYEAMQRWRWMGDSAELRLYNPRLEPVAATLALTTVSYTQPRVVRYTLNEWELGAHTVAADRPATFELRFLLPPGEHTLTLQAPAAPDPARGGTPISVRVFAIAAEFDG